MLSIMCQITDLHSPLTILQCNCKITNISRNTVAGFIHSCARKNTIFHKRTYIMLMINGKKKKSRDLPHYGLVVAHFYMQSVETILSRSTIYPNTDLSSQSYYLHVIMSSMCGASFHWITIFNSCYFPPLVSIYNLLRNISHWKSWTMHGLSIAYNI